MFQFFQDQIVGQILAVVIPIIVTALLGWAAVLYARITGKELEAKHREALQMALTNGVNWAVQQILNGKLSKDGTIPEASKPAVVAKAQQYVTSSVPDAVRKFQISQPTMEKLIEAKLPSSAPKSLTES